MRIGGRRNAASALGDLNDTQAVELNDSRAIEPLINASNDENSFVRSALQEVQESNHGADLGLG
jgi:HEAT repeat protein